MVETGGSPAKSCWRWGSLPSSDSGIIGRDDGFSGRRKTGSDGGGGEGGGGDGVDGVSLYVSDTGGRRDGVGVAWATGGGGGEVLLLSVRAADAGGRSPTNCRGSMPTPSPISRMSSRCGGGDGSGDGVMGYVSSSGATKDRGRPAGGRKHLS